jgi:hypothetical protein
LRGKYFLESFLFLLVSSVALLGGGVGSENHDVAVTRVVAWPELALPSYVYVNVTVENQGISYETFTVTVHADNNTAASAAVADLAQGSNKTLELTCDLFPFRDAIFPPPWPVDGPMIANVTIQAEATVISHENDTADNTYIDGTVRVIWWILDVNGDGRINILDLFAIARIFGNVDEVHPFWDFNQDGQVNILDVFLLAKSFGRVYFDLPTYGPQRRTAAF